jgi:hypothetical protein
MNQAARGCSSLQGNDKLETVSQDYSPSNLETGVSTPARLVV